MTKVFGVWQKLFTDAIASVMDGRNKIRCTEKNYTFIVSWQLRPIPQWCFVARTEAWFALWDGYDSVLFKELHPFKFAGFIIASASEEMIAVNPEDNLLKRQKRCSLAADKKGVPENQKYLNRRWNSHDFELLSQRRQVALIHILALGKLHRSTKSRRTASSSPFHPAAPANCPCKISR